LIPNHHPLVATATAVATARHSPPPQPRLLSGFIVVVVVVSSSSLPSPLSFPPLFCDLFDCCVCSVVVSSPLPHPVVAIPPTASAIVIVVVVVLVIVVVVVVYYPPPPRDLFDCCVHVHRCILVLSPRSLAPVASLQQKRVAHGPVNACPQAEGPRTAHRRRWKPWLAAPRMTICLVKKCHGGLLGNTSTPA
jgi:hypothetical protein